MASDAEREGTAALAASADTETQAAVAALLERGYRWEYDQEVPGVLGVVLTGTRRAAVVVYAPGRDGFRDFEVNDDLLYPPDAHLEVDGTVVARTRKVNL